MKVWLFFVFLQLKHKTAMPNKKILGIGSALVDILTQIPEENILQQFNLPKGSMTYVDAATSVKIGESLKQYGSTMAAGGSAANTVSGLAKLGVESGFLSKIGKDEVGRFFEKEMLNTNVKPQLLTSDTPSGRVQAIVTPDGERTFATCLGAAAEMRADDITPELFTGWDIFYVEGYLVANPTMLDKAIDTAKAAGLKIAIDMASYNVVEESRDYFLQLIENQGARSFGPDRHGATASLGFHRFALRNRRGESGCQRRIRETRQRNGHHRPNQGQCR